MEQNVNNKLLKSDSNFKDLHSVCARNRFETLRDEADGNTIYSVYESLSVAIEESSIEILRKITRSPKRPLMIDVILIL